MIGLPTWLPTGKQSCADWNTPPPPLKTRADTNPDIATRLRLPHAASPTLQARSGRSTRLAARDNSIPLLVTAPASKTSTPPPADPGKTITAITFDVRFL